MLFADVVGFSRMVETLTLEELEALMTRFYDTIAAITFRYDATLDKFIGDAVMALVGAPLSQTPSHQASIALTMAADWHQAIESLGLEYLGKPLKLRIGIHQGEVAVGAFGGEHRLDYTVLGSAVNIAARLEKLARLVQPLSAKLLSLNLAYRTMHLIPWGCSHSKVSLRR